MEKMMILELGQEIWKMILEQLACCENKKEKKKCSKNFQKRKQHFQGFDKGIYKGSDSKSFQWTIREQFQNKNI